jgi:hypothetical protein
VKEQKHFQDPVDTAGQMNQTFRHLLGPKKKKAALKMKIEARKSH